MRSTSEDFDLSPYFAIEEESQSASRRETLQNSGRYPPAHKRIVSSGVEKVFHHDSLVIVNLFRVKLNWLRNFDYLGKMLLHDIRPQWWPQGIRMISRLAARQDQRNASFFVVLH